jgi:ATP-dependent exoDNAse (exonuclease V) beta subunit
VAPGCPRFGDDTVIDRPSKSPVLPGDGIRPGLHKPRKGRHRVVWWDPYLLDESPAGKPGVRRYQILQATDEPVEEKGRLEQEAWRERRRSLLERGRHASLRATTVTGKSETAQDVPGEDTVEMVQVDRVRGRPAGKSFGSLVHELLATVDLDADPGTLEPLARTFGRILDNTESEIEAAVQAAVKALEHPLLRRARAAAECHRETPVVYHDTEGELIEGVPDLVFRDDPASPWTVVDFKTDARLDIGQDAYRKQVALYMEALHRATGVEAKGVLLYI